MHAIIVVDLGFGDAGKGSLVDYYVRHHHARSVIRFNGGAQAAHNVVTPDARHHTFSQFGSGTFVDGVGTHLSRFMLVDPLALLQEEKHLRRVGVVNAFQRLTIDPAAPIVTPFQRAANRLRELQRGTGRHGSCGMGVGETMADLLADPSSVLQASDLGDRSTVLEKLRYMQRLKRSQVPAGLAPGSAQAAEELALLDDPQAPREFADLFCHIAEEVRIVPTAETLDTRDALVFEGAQGVLLDEWHGFHPYTTWSTTTFANALALLKESCYPGQVTRVGAMRAYMTRHGPGPFVTEDTALGERIPDVHNGTNAWQREFRVGWPDLVLLRYALAVAGGVDELAVTCLDRLERMPAWKVCTDYEHQSVECFEGGRLRPSPTPDLVYQERLTAALGQCKPVYTAVAPQGYLDWLEQELESPVRLASFGPTCRDKLVRSPAPLPTTRALAL